MFDLVIFSSFWPRGLYLAEQLSKQGQKIAYVLLDTKQVAPFGLFVEEAESSQEVRDFLESLGFFLRQKEGFCLAHSGNSWNFQEMGLKKEGKNLKKEQHFLSHQLMARVFEGNYQVFSPQKVNFFWDYFLYEESVKKTKSFKENHPEIHFEETSYENIQPFFSSKDFSFLISQKEMTSRKYLWLAEEEDLYALFSIKKKFSPEWKWRSLSFEADAGKYTDIIPSHFVSLKDLSSPWTHDNLLSVFHRGAYWDVWFKSPYHGRGEDLLDSISVHLESLFKKDLSFRFLEKEQNSGFCIYGEEIFKDKKAEKALPKKVNLPSIKDTLHGDLMNQINYEKQCIDKGVFAL